MIKGLRTALYPAPDLSKAKAWYESVFQRKPNSTSPFTSALKSVGSSLVWSRMRSLEVLAKGLMGRGGIRQELRRLRSIGVTVVGDSQEVGRGIKVIDIADPFGNLVGLIENPHFTMAKVQ